MKTFRPTLIHVQWAAASLAVAAFALAAWYGYRASENEAAELTGIDADVRIVLEANELRYLAARMDSLQAAYAAEFDRRLTAPTPSPTPAVPLPERQTPRLQFLAAITQFRESFKRLSAETLSGDGQKMLEIVRTAFEDYVRADERSIGALRRDPDGAGERQIARLIGTEGDLAGQVAAPLSRVALTAAVRAKRKADGDDGSAQTTLRRAAIAGLVGSALTALYGAIAWRLTRARRRQITQLDSQARTDQLTGVGNRRRWEEALPAGLEQAKLTRTVVAVAIIDLDRFKQYNDTHGHPAGDRLLAETARAIANGLREGDLIARYGGEEFVLMLPGCTSRQAEEIVDRVRVNIPDKQTFSAGVTHSMGDEFPVDVLTRADEALYEAKQGGRARTVLNPPPQVRTRATSPL